MDADMDAGSGHADDLELEEELRRIADVLDPVPPHLVRAAIESYTFRALDAELAELVFDSLATPQPVRVVGGPRLLTFQSSALTVEVEVTGDGPVRRIIGRLIPAGPERPAQVEIRSRDQVIPVDADELGRFSADLRGAGPFSLRHGDVVTEWFSA
ncbi:hypothetical protein HKK72_30820 [Actinomadura sp. HBU206391]|nr:hypothetical protein [Actinomadura sp. HBU206391]